MRRLLALGTILAVLLCCTYVLADGNPLPTIPGDQVTLQVSTIVPEDLAAGYIRQKLYPPRSGLLRTKKPAGANLTGVEQALYIRLMEDIAAVAAGGRTSTVFRYPAEEIYPKYRYTAEELEVSTLVTVDEVSGQASISAEAAEKMTDVMENVDFDSVLSCLLTDAPYELYWFDRGQGMMVGYPGISSDWETVFLDGNLSIWLCVAGDYAVAGTEIEPFEVDPKYGTGVDHAAANARAIVEEHKNKTDYARLAAYRDEICSLVSYNDEAAEGSVPYGNPWQLIWVFDGDETTNVVCEGYAKAFQYLNDISGSAGVSVICATGQMDGGNHMWNVVNMDNGKNYLADITNCDNGMIGYPYELFLAGYSEGSVADGYTLVVDDYYTVRYDYMDNPYPAGDLEIWDKSYAESLALKPDTPVYSLSSDIGYTGYRFAIRMDEAYDCIHILETGETLVPDGDGQYVLCGPIGDGNMTFTISAEREGFISPYGTTLAMTVKPAPDNGLVFPAALEEIGAEAFRGTGAETAVFPENIQTIGEYAFADNPDLSLVELNGQQAGEGAFDNSPQVVFLVEEEDVGQCFEDGIRFLVKE